MLQSTMSWYTVGYSSPVPQFENKPIVVVVPNQQGNMENRINALHLTGGLRIMAFPFTRRFQTPCAEFTNPPGPHQKKKYTFLYGGKDKTWIKRFSEIETILAKDPVIREARVSIGWSCVEKSRKWKRRDPWNQKITNLVLSYENDYKWVVLTEGEGHTMDVIVHGTTILNVLEEFEKWKVDVHKKGFELCFREYHRKLL